MSDDFFLRNKTTRAVITGGTQGLGLAIAQRLAREGATHIVIAGRRPQIAEAAVASVKALGAECLFVQADVAVPGDCAKLMDAAIARCGTINALVNSAATTGRGSLLETSLATWDEHFNTNVRGPFLLMQRLVRHLLDRGAPGTIVNILSQSAHCGQSFLVPYSASKAALANLTKNVAASHASKRIRCNGIMAGWMDTPGEMAVQKKWHGKDESWLAQAEAGRPMGQLAKPEQLASLVAYMLSPESGVMTGALVDYDQNVPGSYPE